VNFPDGGVRMTSGLLIGLQRIAGCTLTAFWG
jgi:hypothetical protein